MPTVNVDFGPRGHRSPAEETRSNPAGNLQLPPLSASPRERLPAPHSPQTGPEATLSRSSTFARCRFGLGATAAGECPPSPSWLRAGCVRWQQAAAGSVCDRSLAPVKSGVGDRRQQVAAAQADLQAGGRRFDPGWRHAHSVSHRGRSAANRDAGRARRPVLPGRNPRSGGRSRRWLRSPPPREAPPTAAGTERRPSTPSQRRSFRCRQKCRHSRRCCRRVGRWPAHRETRHRAYR